MNFKAISFGLISLVVLSSSIAQVPTAPPKIGEAHLKTTKGGFKVTSPGDRKAFGKVKVSFRGTLLIVGYEGNAPITHDAGLRIEYENKKRERIEFFGKGTVTLDGKFRAIQFFGGDLDMTWVGNGICRVFGEFDKNGETGTFDVKGDRQRPWGSGGTTFTVPPRDTIIPPKIKPKGSGG